LDIPPLPSDPTDFFRLLAHKAPKIRNFHAVENFAKKFPCRGTSGFPATHPNRNPNPNRNPAGSSSSGFAGLESSTIPIAVQALPHAGHGGRKWSFAIDRIYQTEYQYIKSVWQ
jgi:hypothetical protein